jgi:hypothetical protein
MLVGAEQGTCAFLFIHGLINIQNVLERVNVRVENWGYDKP